MRYAQSMITLAAIWLWLPAPAVSAIAWIDDGLSIAASGIAMYTTEKHVVVTSGAFVFVAAPGLLGGDTDHVFVLGEQLATTPSITNWHSRVPASGAESASLEWCVAKDSNLQPPD